MPQPDKFTAFVIDHFSPLGGITEHYMFGGWCLYCDGTPFCLISSKGKVYLKTDETTTPKFEAEGLDAFVVTGGKLTSYYEAPAVIFEDTDAMREWCTAAIAVARKKKAKKKKIR